MPLRILEILFQNRPVFQSHLHGNLRERAVGKESEALAQQQDVFRVHLHTAGHIQQRGIFQHVLAEPMGTGMMVQHIGGQAICRAELTFHHALVPVRAVLIAELNAGCDIDAFNVIDGKLVFPAHGIQAVQRCLYPHIGGPVLHQDLFQQPFRAKIAVQPSIICKAPHHHGIAAFNVQNVPQARKFVALGHLRQHGTVEGNKSKLLMIKIGHVFLGDGIYHRRHAPGSANQLVELTGITAQYFSGRDG